ncbi:hypothetical protein BZA77DRAFT_290896 [Pyronema omphalodes]|nr:hypothetical protein BZA77DRAFT_290896 [Pyronema omphalodes]
MHLLPALLPAFLAISTTASPVSPDTSPNPSSSFAPYDRITCFTNNDYHTAAWSFVYDANLRIDAMCDRFVSPQLGGNGSSRWMGVNDLSWTANPGAPAGSTAKSVRARMYATRGGFEMSAAKCKEAFKYLIDKCDFKDEGRGVMITHGGGMYSDDGNLFVTIEYHPNCCHRGPDPDDSPFRKSQ